MYPRDFLCSLPDSVSAMTFGKFGREDSALVLVTLGGALIVKILKRTAQFEKMESSSGPLAAAKVGSGMTERFFTLMTFAHGHDHAV